MKHEAVDNIPLLYHHHHHHHHHHPKEAKNFVIGQSKDIRFDKLTTYLLLAKPMILAEYLFPEKILNFLVYGALGRMDVGFCVPASPPNPSRGRPSRISAALLCILTSRKKRLNRGDLGPTRGMMVGRKMEWHKRGISGMGPSSKLGPPKITRAKGKMCLCVLN